jgi:hypothetical protein
MPHTARRLPVLILAAALLTAASCSTPRPERPAPCVPANQVDLVIRWGTEHDSVGTVEQYTMNTKGEIFRYEGPAAERTDGAFLVAIDQGIYCERAKATMDTFLKTQALNVRGKRGRFVDYRNTKTDVYLRAVWNPDLQTFQSRDMRELYDDLMKLIPR